MSEAYVNTRMPTEAPAATSASATRRERCLKCAVMKESGNLSCCARGGAWFQKCGDAGDTTFDHTWTEGIEACERKSFGTCVCEMNALWWASRWQLCLSPQPLQVRLLVPLRIRRQLLVLQRQRCRLQSPLPVCLLPISTTVGVDGMGVYVAYVNFHMRAEVLPTTSATSINSRRRCPKCGKVKKSGKLSCCARSAAWFQKCGDANDSTFDHTWFEGVQACDGFTNFLSFTEPAQVMRHHGTIISQSANKTWPRNFINERDHIRPTDTVSTDGTEDTEESFKLAKNVALTSLLFIVVPLQT